MALELLLYLFDRSPVAPIRPISNSSEILLAEALGNDTVQTTTGARLTTHNALTIGGVSVRLGAVMVCFWNASGISVIVEAAW